MSELTVTQLKQLFSHKHKNFIWRVFLNSDKVQLFMIAYTHLSHLY